MVRKLGRAPSPEDEHAYYQWAQKYGWNDRRCDNCSALLPEDGVHVHDVYDNVNGVDIPETVYCSEFCFVESRQPRRLSSDRGGVAKQKDWDPIPDDFSFKLDWL